MSGLTVQQRRAFEIAEAAFEHAPGPARRAAVDAAVGDDAALRAAVEALLDADDAAHTLLDGEAFLPSDAAPETVGPWRVTGELGRGGMGVVYAAERSDGVYEQQAALKVAAVRGSDAARTAERFDQERRLLARLRHPGIAALLDGGVTDDGRPYFLMERVDGVPLTEAAVGLGLRDRLELFVQVCDAVAHAHRLLVVHRDLKPSNVLVATDADGTRHAKLLDFGIAKALDRTEDVLTQTAAPLTPAYAAPEQISNQPVTAATDVYALGVLLYQVLTGQRPYSFAERSLAEVARVVCETTPERPSQAALAPTVSPGVPPTEDDTPQPSAQAPALASVPAARLRGDLDAIVMRALRKEPERRYATAADLADELRRYLDGRPVEARGESRLYVAGRFVRRHRAATAAVVVALAAIVGGSVASALQARRAAREAQRAEVTLEWLLGTFESVDPEALDGERIQARDLLAPGLARIRDLDDQPLIQASVMEGLGRLGLSLGLLAEADSLLEGAIAVRSRAQGPDHPDVARPRLLLAQSLRDQREYARAEAEARAALASLASAGPSARAQALIALATILLFSDEGEHDAEPLYRQALALAERAGDDAQRIDALSGLGEWIMYDEARLSEAARAFEQAVALAETSFGRRDVRTADAWEGHAHVLELQGELGRAGDLLERALAVRESAAGADSYSLAKSLYAVGRIRALAEQHEAAVPFYRRAAQAYGRSALGDAHLWHAYASIGLAQSLTKSGRPAEAIAPFEEGLALYADAMEPDDYRFLSAQGSLGIARYRAGDPSGLALADASLRRLLAAEQSGPYAAPAARALAEALRDASTTSAERTRYRTVLAELAAEDA